MATSQKSTNSRSSAEVRDVEMLHKPIASDNGCGANLPDSDRSSEIAWKKRGRPTEDTIARFWAKVKKTDTCWLWTASCFGGGYGQFTSRRYGSQRKHYAHRFSWELHFGPIPKGAECLHKCDVRACIRPDHLFLGSQADNLTDARQKGRLDETLPRTRKLTYDDRLAIYHAPRFRGVNAYLAREYGVTKAAITHIRKGRFARPEGSRQPVRPQPQESRGALHGATLTLKPVPYRQLPVIGDVR